MLKWIFGLLLLVNILFFALMHWGSALVSDAGNPPLQAELNPDKVQLLALDAPVSAVASAVPAASAVAASDVQPASQPVAAPVAPAPVAVSVPAAPPVSPAAPKAPSLPKAPPQAKAAAPVVPPAAKAVCMEWGEFSGNTLQQAEKALESLHLDKHMTVRASEHGTAFWVYIPPIKNHAKLMKKVEQLKSLGIQDHFIVQEAGPWQNAISLGVFKSKDAAQSYLGSLRGKGVKSAKLGKRSNKLKVTVFEFSKLDSATAAHITELGKNFPDEELKQVSCGE